MNKNFLQDAVLAIKHQEFQRAKNILERILLADHGNAEVLHKLGYVNFKLGELDEAEEQLKNAILIKPDSHVFYQHLANILKAKGQYAEAENFFQKALSLQPFDPSLYNNYGLLLYARGEYSKADDAFKSALKQKSDYTDAMYNLALSLKAQKKKEEAIAALLAIYHAFPNYLRTYFLIAQILIDEKLFDDAENFFNKLESIVKNDVDTLVGITKSWLDAAQYSRAKISCEKLFKLIPENIEVIYNLAIIETKLDKLDTAIEYYHQILNVKSDYFPALNNIAVIYLRKSNIDAAKYYFEQALKQNPDSEAIKYTLSAINGNTAYDKAPQDYIAKLFDDYAEHFDIHLRKSLEYKVPEKLKYYFDNTVSDTRKNDLVIVDLGCGTGLCGEQFKPIANKLIGIDLSINMLEQAKSKNCYDELIVADNTAFLSKHLNEFDLVIASDVFVYQGNLEPILTACFYCLKQNGIVAFTTEKENSVNFRLLPTGRFAHCVKYVEDLARKIGFEVLASREDFTRIQGISQLSGSYFIFSKKLVATGGLEPPTSAL